MIVSWIVLEIEVLLEYSVKYTRNKTDENKLVPRRLLAKYQIDKLRRLMEEYQWCTKDCLYFSKKNNHLPSGTVPTVGILAKFLGDFSRLGAEVVFHLFWVSVIVGLCLTWEEAELGPQVLPLTPSPGTEWLKYF